MVSSDLRGQIANLHCRCLDGKVTEVSDDTKEEGTPMTFICQIYSDIPSKSKQHRYLYFFGCQNYYCNEIRVLSSVHEVKSNFETIYDELDAIEYEITDLM